MCGVPSVDDEQVGSQVDEGAEKRGHAGQVNEQHRLLFDDKT